MTDQIKNQSLHRHIYLDLERKIVTGEIGFMDQLPPLPRLCGLYGVSEAPVRRALDELARDGLIEKRRGRGKGTVVIKRLMPTTLRVLLMYGEQEHKTHIEAYHEVFDLIAGVQEAARAHGCRVQVVSRDGFDSLPPADRATGYLIVGMLAAEYRAGAELVARHGAHAVGLNAPGSGYVTSSVRVDMRYGANMAVSYLAQLGHRRIAYIGGVQGEWMTPRFEGYRQALEEYGLPWTAEYVRETSGLDAAEDASALAALLDSREPPTALFTASDFRALHLLNACRARGIAVPRQISICGYDDIGEAAAVEPGLTTIHHPRHELGKLAVDRLYDLIHGEAVPSDCVVRPHLVVRESCAPPVR